MSRVFFKNDVMRFTKRDINNPKLPKSTDAIVEEDQSDQLNQEPVDWGAKNSIIRSFQKPKSVLELYKLGQLSQTSGPLIITKKENNTQKISQPYLPSSSLIIVDRIPIKPVQDEQQQIGSKKKVSYKKKPTTLATEANQTSPKQEATEGDKKKKPKREKKIKKADNFVRLDLKKKFQDRFRGNMYMNRRKYMPNGQLKYKYRKKAQNAEIQQLMSQSYDIYMSSISKSLYITFDLEDDNTLPQQPKEEVQVTGTSKQQMELLIKQVWGFESFRYGQYETIMNILAGKSTLFVSETGSGKSLSYILSSIVQDGLAIVISPLISLMLDQIQSIPQILPAACISSLLNRDQKNRIIEMVRDKKIKLLYMTPQALQTDLVYQLKTFPPINFVCIDEAHCVSELSHNFRTTYLIINDLINNHFRFKDNKKVVLCLTATANNQTIQSIMDKMGIDELIRSDSLRRKNLCVTISRETHDNYRALIDYLRTDQVKRLKGILVYCRSRKITNDAYNYLNNSGFRAAVFHAGLDQKQKNQLLQNFRSGAIKVVVATIALGMGLDFQNLDCVIHINLPKSVESYVQEIGRAGRRGKKAYCHMFLSPEDYFTNRNFILAERLEMENIAYFIKEIQKHSSRFLKVGQPNSSGKKNLKLKRDVFEEEEIFLSDQQEMRELEQKLNQHSLQQARKGNGKICCARTKNISQTLDLKIESIITILLKIEKLTNKKLIEVLAPSFQILKISFFKTNQSKIEEQSEFFRTVIKNCKNVRGTLHIKLVDKCNEMSIDPVDLISKIQQISNVHFLRIEYEHDVIIWRYVGEITFTEFRDKYQTKLFDEMAEVDQGALNKLNVLYTLAFLNSDISVQRMIKNNVLGRFGSLDEKNKVTSVSELFDEYFTTGTKEFYQKISQGEHFLPTYILEPKQKEEIIVAVKDFLKNEWTSSPNQIPSEFIKKYRSGMIITRLLLGINTQVYNYKMYGTHPYWGRYKENDYDELITTVAKAVSEFIQQQ